MYHVSVQEFFLFYYFSFFSRSTLFRSRINIEFSLPPYRRNFANIFFRTHTHARTLWSEFKAGAAPPRQIELYEKKNIDRSAENPSKKLFSEYFVRAHELQFFARMLPQFYTAAQTVMVACRRNEFIDFVSTNWHDDAAFPLAVNAHENGVT